MKRIVFLMLCLLIGVGANEMWAQSQLKLTFERSDAAEGGVAIAVKNQNDAVVEGVTATLSTTQTLKTGGSIASNIICGDKTGTTHDDAIVFDITITGLSGTFGFNAMDAEIHAFDVDGNYCATADGENRMWDLHFSEGASTEALNEFANHTGVDIAAGQAKESGAKVYNTWAVKSNTNHSANGSFVFRISMHENDGHTADSYLGIASLRLYNLSAYTTQGYWQKVNKASGWDRLHVSDENSPIADRDRQHIDREGWRIVASSDCLESGTVTGDVQKGKAHCIIDANPFTYWHSRWNDQDPTGVKPESIPEWFIIDLGEDTAFQGWSVRARTNDAGKVISIDSEGVNSPIGNGLLQSFNIYACSADALTLDDNGYPTGGYLQEFAQPLTEETSATTKAKMQTLLDYTARSANLDYVPAVGDKDYDEFNGMKELCAPLRTVATIDSLKWEDYYPARTESFNSPEYFTDDNGKEEMRIPSISARYILFVATEEYLTTQTRELPAAATVSEFTLYNTVYAMAEMKKDTVKSKLQKYLDHAGKYVGQYNKAYADPIKAELERDFSQYNVSSEAGVYSFMGFYDRLNYAQSMRDKSGWYYNLTIPNKIKDNAYYRIVSAYSGFSNSQKNMSAQVDTARYKNPARRIYPGWKAHNVNDKTQVWQFAAKDTTATKIEFNAKSAAYNKSFTSDYENLATEQLTPMLLSEGAYGFTVDTLNADRGFGEPIQFAINFSQDPDNPKPLHAEGHKNGSGLSGNIILYNEGKDSPSAWMLEEVADFAEKESDYFATAQATLFNVAGKKMNKFSSPELKHPFQPKNYSEFIGGVWELSTTDKIYEVLPQLYDLGLEPNTDLYYRFKNIGRGRVLSSYDAAGEEAVGVNPATDDAGRTPDVIWRVIPAEGEPEWAGLYHIKHMNSGKYVGTLSGTLGEDHLLVDKNHAGKFTFESRGETLDANDFVIRENNVNVMHMWNTGDMPIGYYNSNLNTDKASHWNVDEVATLTVKLPARKNGASDYDTSDTRRFASAYFPFPVEVTDGKGYVEGVSSLEPGSEDNTYKFYLKEMPAGSAIAAHQGIILENDGESTTATLKLLPEGTSTYEVKDIFMNGTNLKMAVEANTVYSFGYGSVSRDLGFFKYTGTSLRNNCAYLRPAYQTAMRGFTISFDEPTGIDNVEATADTDAPIFDLSGRRVQNAVKGGVYIQNGRKFIVK